MLSKQCLEMLLQMEKELRELEQRLDEVLASESHSLANKDGVKSG